LPKCPMLDHSKDIDDHLKQTLVICMFVICMCYTLLFCIFFLFTGQADNILRAQGPTQKNTITHCKIDGITLVVTSAMVTLHKHENYKLQLNQLFV